MSNSVYFISDLHLGHVNLMKFRRDIHSIDFKDIYEHNDWLVSNWNSVVKRQSDLVWVLGDISWGSQNLHYLAQMNGIKKLIMGNHDRLKITEYFRYFSDVRAYEKKYDFIMSHVPIHPNEMEYRGWKHNVHGHVHHIEKQNVMEQSKYFNVNVDIIGPRPIKLEALRERIKNAG